MSMFMRSFALLALIAVSAPLRTSAQEAVTRYQVRLGAVPVGEIRMAHGRRADAYEVRAIFATRGVAGALAPVRFDISALGRFVGGTPRPASYREDLDTSRRQSRTEIAFAAGDGRIDPATALWIAVGDRPREGGCGAQYDVFDGTRGNRLRIARGTLSGAVLTCRGRFDRVAGYTAREMAENSGFGFTTIFDLKGERLILREAQTQTIFGRVILRRR